MTGVSHSDLLKLLDEFAAVIKTSTRRELDPELIADALNGFSDTLGNLHEEDCDDVLTADEWRKEIGLCPDDPSHFYGESCRAQESPTWMEARAAA